MTGQGKLIRADDARLEFFGCELNPVRFEQWAQKLEHYISGDEKRIVVAHHNLNSLYYLHRSELVQRFYKRSQHCYIDGISVCLINTLSGRPTWFGRRFSLMDRFPDLLGYAQERGWRVFYLGASEEVVIRAIERFRSDFSNLAFQFCSGYFENNSGMVDKINRFQPDILLVGMGMEKQEAWILDNIDLLDVSVITQAGGTLGYYGGEQPKPPMWVSNIGLAWLYRLVLNPRRLSKRYLVKPWALLPPIFRLILRRS